MKIRLTEEQQKCVSSRGRVIVSASAGSGKTFVMIERLVSLILEGADVRQTLAVTFTNKAAAQMREKLRSALCKRIAESGDAERKRLKEQLAALPLADISTIHAFCSRLVKTYFYLAEVSPSFRVVSPDDADGARLSARALDEVFEDAYEREDGLFHGLLSVYFRRKKDETLRKTVKTLYAAVRGRADYLDLLRKTGEEDGFSDVCEFLAEDVRSRARLIAERTEELGLFFAERGHRALENCKQILLAARALESGGLFDLAGRAKEPPKIATTPPARAGAEGYYELKETGRLSAAVKELYKELSVYASEETERARYLDGRARARALAGLVLRYDEAYTRLKDEAGVLDYNDLEHCALKVLSSEEARAALRGKYRYIFVDEYQDVNPAQEQIVDLLGGEEVFLVGDAKQSIYGFRGSRSEFFVRKCGEYTALSLTENFRSASAVLEAVNRVFSSAMTKASAGLDYREAPMRGGKRYLGNDGGVYFHAVPKTKAERSEREIYSVLREGKQKEDPQAETVCDLIEQEVGSEWFDADAGIKKTLSYGDIAVLVRKSGADADRLLSAMSERGIPVTASATVNICDFWEVRLVIDWLSYLDNGEQDIPFAGALLSRIGGVSEAELTRIRTATDALCKQEGHAPPYTFRDACRLYARRFGDDITAKLNTVWQKAEEYRHIMQVRSAAEVIGLLLAEGLETQIVAKKDGTSRMRRVRRLIEEAEGSVNEFLRKLKTLGYRVDFSESGGENAVKLITMHASKGLEYPVVFLIGLENAFDRDDDEVLCTDRFGFSPKSYDVSARVAYENVHRRASALYAEREGTRGELNLLYVAMTRAKYRLHMLYSPADGAIAPQYAKRFTDFLDMRDCSCYVVPPPERLREPNPRAALVYRPDGELLEALKSVYCRPYPYAESTLLPVKSSATELMRAERERVPAGERGASGMTAAGIDEGLAYHAFLQHVRFGKDVDEELSRMRGQGLLDGEQLALLDGERLRAMLALPSLRALEGNPHIEREKTFLVSLSACEVGLGSGKDEIVFQGAIDLLCRDDDGWLILDYKYSSHDDARLKEDYALQISLYRKAVSRALGVREERVRARIVNILRLYEVEM